MFLTGDTNLREQHMPQEHRKPKITKCNLILRAQAKITKTVNEWEIHTLEDNHNHGTLDIFSAAQLFRYRAQTDEKVEQIISMTNTRQSPSQIVTFLQEQRSNQTLAASDISNLIQKKKRLILNRGKKSYSMISWTA